MSKLYILNTCGYYIGSDGCIYTPNESKLKIDTELTLKIGGVQVTKPVWWYKLLARYRVSLPNEVAGRISDVTFNVFGKVFAGAPKHNVSSVTPIVLHTGHAVALNWSTVAVNKFGEVIDARTYAVIYKQKHYISKVTNVYRNVPIARQHVPLHRLMLNAWVYNDNTSDKYLGNHIDGIKTNNTLSNLEWCSYSDNIKHAVKTGLRTDNITAVTRDRINFRLTEYPSIHELCRALGLHNMSRAYFDNMLPGKLIAGLEIRVSGDNRPWYFITGNEPPVPKSARTRFDLTIDGATEVYYKYNQVAKRIGLTNFVRLETLHKKIDNSDNISLQITTLVKVKKSYQVFRVSDSAITEYSSVAEIVKCTGLDRSVVYKACRAPENYVYGGYAIREATDTRWCTDFVIRNVKKAIPIKVTDNITSEVIQYTSILKAADALDISAKTLVRYMKLNIPYNQFSFSN